MRGTRRCARPTKRSGLSAEHVEFAGYLPDHHVITGFRVTPVVGFVNRDYQLRIAEAEVHDAFEVPLDFILDAANHKSRRRNLGGVDHRSARHSIMVSETSGGLRPVC